MNKPEIALAFVEGRSGTCHNAVTDGQTYWLHGSPIAVKSADTVQFYWHGYYTPTTASHMNSILRAMGVDVRVSYADARDRKATHFVCEVK